MHFELKINKGLELNKIIVISGIDFVSYQNFQITFFIFL